MNVPDSSKALPLLLVACGNPNKDDSSWAQDTAVPPVANVSLYELGREESAKPGVDNQSLGCIGLDADLDVEMSDVRATLLEVSQDFMFDRQASLYDGPSKLAGPVSAGAEGDLSFENQDGMKVTAGDHEICITGNPGEAQTETFQYQIKSPSDWLFLGDDVHLGTNDQFPVNFSAVNLTK